MKRAGVPGAGAAARAGRAGATARAGRAGVPGSSQARQTAAAGLLGGACCAWAAVTVSGGGQAALLAVAAVCVAADLVRIAAAATPSGQADIFSSPAVRLRQWFRGAVTPLPAAEGAALAAMILEVAHPSRPWHTGVLGAALLCYLLATHLAESGAPPRVLRRQLPVLAAGLGLLVLGAGAAMLPAAGPGFGSGALRVLAAVAAIAAGILALPG